MNDSGHPLKLVAAETEEPELDLGRILESLVRGKWMILVLYTVAVVLAAGYVVNTDPVYEATSMVYVDKQGGTLEEMTLGGSGAGASIATQMEIIKSRALASRVLDRMYLLEVNPETGKRFDLLQNEQKGQTEIVNSLRNSALSVRSGDRDVDLIYISAKSIVPEEATVISNLYAEEYESYDRMVSRQSSTALRQFFDQQVQRLDSTVRVEELESH